MIDVAEREVLRAGEVVQLVAEVAVVREDDAVKHGNRDPDRDRHGARSRRVRLRRDLSLVSRHRVSTGRAG